MNAVKPYVSFSYDDYGLIVGIYGFIFLTQLIPLTILHLNYYKTNKGDSISYDDDKKEIVFKKDDIEEVVFNLEEIKVVKRYASYSYFSKGPNLLAWGNYNYSEIFLADGTRIVITSLLIFDIKLPIPKSKIEIDRGFFEMVNGPSVLKPKKFIR